MIYIQDTMEFEKALQKLQRIGQEHILHYWKDLNVPQRTELLDQIGKLDCEKFLIQRQLILFPEHSKSSEIKPFIADQTVGNKKRYKQGKELIEQGKVGCLLVAGGQGTRLNFDGPKGMYPISLIKQKSLFQFFSEKVAAASKQALRPLPLAIMTSPINDEQTRQFFYKNRFFGLLPDQVTFYSQKMLPMIDLNGNLFLQTPYRFAEGPDGNGSSLIQFFESGIWERWNKAGVEMVNFVLIDNPLADPFDAELIGLHEEKGADVTIKCIKRDKPDEKVGIIVSENDQVLVKEYFEIPEEEQTATLPDGTLKHPCANISLFCFSMSLIKEAAKKERKLPLHCALKSAKSLTSDVRAWKFETFIFDILHFTNKVLALLYPREECFAPLKNAEGDNSPQSVKEALLEADRRVLTQLMGKKPPKDHIFELSQEFYYPTPEIEEKWKGHPFPQDQSYITD